jgi:hypothetical protein
MLYRKKKRKQQIINNATREEGRMERTTKKEPKAPNWELKDSQRVLFPPLDLHCFGKTQIPGDTPTLHLQQQKNTQQQQHQYTNIIKIARSTASKRNLDS